MSVLPKIYLAIYNLVLAVGWVYILILTFESRLDIENIHRRVRTSLQIFQTAAILEIVHAAIGIVKSNVLLTIFQVSSRVFIVWAVLESSPPSVVSLGLPLLLLAWSITEIVRYSYYFLNIIGLAQLLVWCRYSLFIALYPVGVLGELMCVYTALFYIRDHQTWTYRMPNKLNLALDFHYVMYVVLLLYIPLFPKLYLHMFEQRRKILGGEHSSKVHRH